MAKIIMTNGYPSFQAWKDAGYPGAVKGASPAREPDLRRGLCEWSDGIEPQCGSVASGTLARIVNGKHLCSRHVTIQKHIDWATQQVTREKASA